MFLCDRGYGTVIETGRMKTQRTRLPAQIHVPAGNQVRTIRHGLSEPFGPARNLPFQSTAISN